MQKLQVQKPAQDGPPTLSPKARQLRHLSTLDDILRGADRDELSEALGDADELLQSMLTRGIGPTTLSQGLRDKEATLAKLKSRAHAAECREAAAKTKVADLLHQVSLLSAQLKLAEKEKMHMEQVVEQQRKQLRAMTLARRKQDKVINLAKKDQEQLEQMLKDLFDQKRAKTLQIWEVRDAGVQTELQAEEEGKEMDKMKQVIIEQQKEIENYEGFAEQAKQECMLLTTKVVEIVRKNDFLTKALESERRTLKTVADRFCQEQLEAKETVKRLEETQCALRELSHQVDAVRSESEFQPTPIAVDRNSKAEVRKDINSVSEGKIEKKYISVGIEAKEGFWVSPKEREDIKRRHLHVVATAIVQSCCSSGVATVVKARLQRALTKHTVKTSFAKLSEFAVQVGGEKVNEKLRTMYTKLDCLESALIRAKAQREENLKHFAIEKANMQSMIKRLHIREAGFEARESERSAQISSLSSKLSEFQESSAQREQQLQEVVKQRESELADMTTKQRSHTLSIKAEIEQEIVRWQNRANKLQSTIRQLSSNLGSVTNKQQAALETVEQEKRRLKDEMVGVLECMEFITKDLVQLHSSIASLKILSRKAELVHLQKELELSRENEKQLRERSNVLNSSLNVCERHLHLIDPDTVEVQRDLRSSRLRLASRRLKELHKQKQELDRNTARNRGRLQVLLEEAEHAVESHQSQKKKCYKQRSKGQAST